MIVGMLAAAKPCRSANAGLEALKPVSVLTTWTATNPCPSGIVAGTATVRCVALLGAVGGRGPCLTGPLEVATNKLTTDPAVKPMPVITKLLPARIVPGILWMTGVPGTSVAVAVGFGVWVEVRVGVDVLEGNIGVVGVGSGVCVAVRVGVSVEVCVGVGVLVGVGVGL